MSTVLRRRRSGLWLAIWMAKTSTSAAPYANTRLYVLDADLQPCPVGVLGELYIAGVGLARGYWNRRGPDSGAFRRQSLLRRTGRAALPHWRPRDPGARMASCSSTAAPTSRSRSAAIASSPARSRDALTRRPAIAQAAVIAHEDRLVAYVVPSEEIDLQELRQRLAARLPEHMVPAAFVVLDALPLTANGKLDRNALPAPEGSALGDEYVAPTTAEEILLCDLVAELMGIERSACPTTSSISVAIRSWPHGW